MIIGLFFGTIVAYLFIGYYASKRAKGLDDYYIAGRNAGPMFVLGTFAASWLSATGVVGYAGASYTSGIGTVIMWGGIPGFMLAVLCIVTKLYRSNSWTMFDFFANRWNDKKLAYISVFLMFFGLFPYLLSQVMGSANILAGVTGIDYKSMILIVCVVFAALTLSGGAWSVTVTDTSMLFIIFFAFFFLCPFVISYEGGWNAIMAGQMLTNPERFKWTGAALTATGAISINLIWMCGLIAGPHQGSRILIAKDERTALSGVILANTLGTIFVWVMHTMSHGLFSHIKGIKPDQVTVTMFLSLPQEILGALGISALFAAALSTATTMLLTLAMGVGKDVVKRLNPDLSDASMLRITKYSVVGFAVLVGLFAYFSVSAVATWGEAGSAVFACAYFPLLIFGLNWKRATREGAYAALLGGGGIFLVLWIGWKFAGWKMPFGFQPVLFGLIAGLLLMFVVSLMTKPDPKDIAFYESLQTPPKNAFNPATDKSFRYCCAFAVIVGLLFWLAAFTILPGPIV